RAGILHTVIDLFRLEVPVDRHAGGAEPHGRIGGLDEGDIVAHQHADAVTLANAKFLQAAGDPLGAICDLVMATPTRAADDAVEERVIGHLLVRYWRTVVIVVITGLVPVIHVLPLSS